AHHSRRSRPSVRCGAPYRHLGAASTSTCPGSHPRIHGTRSQAQGQRRSVQEILAPTRSEDGMDPTQNEGGGSRKVRHSLFSTLAGLLFPLLLALWFSTRAPCFGSSCGPGCCQRPPEPPPSGPSATGPSTTVPTSTLPPTTEPSTTVPTSTAPPTSVTTT